MKVNWREVRKMYTTYNFMNFKYFFNGIYKAGLDNKLGFKILSLQQPLSVILIRDL